MTTAPQLERKLPIPNVPVTNLLAASALGVYLLVVLGSDHIPPRWGGGLSDVARLQRPVDRLALGPGARCCMGTPLRDARGRAALAWHHGSCVDSPRRKPGPPRAWRRRGTVSGTNRPRCTHRGHPDVVAIAGCSPRRRGNRSSLGYSSRSSGNSRVSPLRPSLSPKPNRPHRPVTWLRRSKRAAQPTNDRTAERTSGRCHEYARMWR